MGVDQSLKMKKIIGVFLAVCFVLSVTAAAASAGGADQNKYRDKKIINDGNTKSLKNDKGKNIHNWKQKFWIWVWVPGHYEFKVIKMGGYDKHHHRTVIKKVIRIWIPGQWELKLLKCNHGIFS